MVNIYIIHAKIFICITPMKFMCWNSQYECNIFYAWNMYEIFMCFTYVIFEMLRMKHLSVITTSQICHLAVLLNRLVDSVRIKKECFVKLVKFCKLAHVRCKYNYFLFFTRNMFLLKLKSFPKIKFIFSLDWWRINFCWSSDFVYASRGTERENFW